MIILCNGNLTVHLAYLQNEKYEVWFCYINNIKICDCDGWRSETTNILYILTSDKILIKM